MRLPIFLAGFMASGKSSFGKKLAKNLQLNFIDLDEFISQHLQKSIAEIFAEIGEKGFRKFETQALKSAINHYPNSVISLGGGTACSEVNLALIKESGIGVYLKVQEELLIGRLRANKSKRPLVANLNNEEIGQFVKTKMKERSPFYESLEIILEKDNPKVEDLLALLT